MDELTFRFTLEEIEILINALEQDIDIMEQSLEGMVYSLNRKGVLIAIEKNKKLLEKITWGKR